MVLQAWQCVGMDSVVRYLQAHRYDCLMSAPRRHSSRHAVRLKHGAGELNVKLMVTDSEH